MLAEVELLVSTLLIQKELPANLNNVINGVYIINWVRVEMIEYGIYVIKRQGWPL